MLADLGVELGVSVDQRGRLVSRLEGLSAQYANVRPLALSIATVLRAFFARNIDEGGRPKWKPLTANTLASKALKGYPSKPLIGSGLLRTAVAQRGARGNVTYVAADGTLKVGVNLPWAKWQQEGTSPYLIVPRKGKFLAFQAVGGKVFAKKVRHPGLPARPFILVQEEDWKEIRLKMKQWAAGELARAEE